MAPASASIVDHRSAWPREPVGNQLTGTDEGCGQVSCRKHRDEWQRFCGDPVVRGDRRSQACAIGKQLGPAPGKEHVDLYALLPQPGCGMKHLLNIRFRVGSRPRGEIGNSHESSGTIEQAGSNSKRLTMAVDEAPKHEQEQHGSSQSRGLPFSDRGRLRAYLLAWNRGHSGRRPAPPSRFRFLLPFS